MMKHIDIFNLNRGLYLRSVILCLIFSLSVFSLAYSQEAKTDNVANAGFDIEVVVKDAATQTPINAAKVSVKTENLSAVTNEQGYFKLTLKSQSAVLSVFAYDYNPVEVPVKGRKQIVIELYADKFTSFFRNQENVSGVAEPTSSILNSLKTNNDFSRTNAVSVDELFQASFGADVRTISRSGLAGSGASLFIRGLNSLNANSQPLFVVDGVIWTNLNDVVSINQGFFSNPLDVIDVNDIESVSVIKDGVTIYGSKASNGVVVIKTKRSKDLVTKISLNVFSGYTATPTSYSMMSGEDFRLYASDMLNSSGLIKHNNVTDYSFLETNPANKKAYNQNHNSTNWNNLIYQTGRVNSYAINATGGDDKSMYYFSLGYTNTKGLVKTTSLDRINARFNADFKFFKRLSMAMNIGFTNVERSLMDDGVDSVSSVTFLSDVKAPFLSQYSFTSDGNRTKNYGFTDEFNVGNPLGVIQKSLNRLKKFRFNVGVTPRLAISKNLILSSQFDYSLDKTAERRFVPMYFTSARMLYGYGITNNEVDNQVMRNKNYFSDTRLSYAKTFSMYHNLSAVFGTRFIQNSYESDYAKEFNTGGNNVTTISGDHDFLQMDGVNNETKSLASYLSVAYDFNKKYFLTGVVSADASSRFGKKVAGALRLMNNSWGVFPAANAGWIVSSEPFMKNNPCIDFLKLRVGYGLTGNDGIQDYESMAYFMTVRYMNKANGLVISNLANNSLKWETTRKANAGMDLNVFKNRLELSVDLFANKTTDLLVLKDLPEVSGLGQYWTNSGSLTNRGFEISAMLKVLNSARFKWELGASVGHYKNEITSLINGADIINTVYGGEVIARVGEALGSFYGYKTNGVYATEAQALASGLKIKKTDGSVVAFGAGDVIFEDVSGANGVPDGYIDEHDKQIIGNPNPDFYGTITNNFMYGRFKLNTVFTYSVGNDVYNYKRSLLESGSNFYNQTTAMLRRWTADGQVTDQPKSVYGDPMGNARFSDRWIEDGSFLRLKTVTLSYDLPLKSNFIDGVNFWVSVNNVFTITKYLGVDPEVSAGNSSYYQGVDAGLLPLTRSYFVGVKFNL